MFALVFLVIAAVLFLIFIILQRRGFKPAFRKLSAYDRMPLLIGQALESGGRAHVTLGANSLYGEDAGVTVAGLSILDYVATSSAISDLSPVATTADATTQPAISDTIASAYRKRRAPERFKPTSARLAGLDSMTLAGEVTSIIEDANVRNNIAIGSFGPEIALISEAAARKHIPQVIGSDRLEAQAVAFAAAEHPLIGEEIFAARAYLEEQPAAIAGLITQDVLRWLVIAIIIIGAILKSFGLLG